MVGFAQQLVGSFVEYFLSFLRRKNTHFIHVAGNILIICALKDVL